jgi:NitT/TauT family transport system permease protein
MTQSIEGLVVELVVSTLLSLGRMFVAYLLSLLLALVIGVVMARNKYVESVLLPILDILQSIPILGFFPAVFLIFINTLGPIVGGELSSIFLIITSLIWNMIFGVYSSIKSLDPSVDYLARIYRLSSIHKFLYIYVPASRSSIAANSIVSWAGGWFFLTSAEVLSMGKTEYRLKGLGSLIIKAFEDGNTTLYITGLLTLSTVILISYLMIWNPFTMKYTDTKILLGFMRIYNSIDRIVSKTWGSIAGKLIMMYNFIKSRVGSTHTVFLILPILSIQYLLYPYPKNLYGVDYSILSKVLRYGEDFLLEVPNTLIRVYSVVVVGLVISVLLAYISHTRFRVGKLVVMSGEVLSSIPAMIWWPILLPLLQGFPYVVMGFIYLQGSLWYTFFNILIFGLSNLKGSILEFSRIYGIRGVLYLSKVFIPSLLPSILAGGLSASGGAWNASIAAEYIAFGDLVVDMGGVGSLLNKQAMAGDVLGILLTSLFMSLIIVSINKLVWVKVLRRISGYYVVE